MKRFLAAFGLCLLLWSPAAKAADDDDDSDDSSSNAVSLKEAPTAEEVSAKLQPKHFLFIGGAGCLVLAGAMDYWADGQGRAAEGKLSVRESASQLRAAQATAAAANMMYALAAASVIYGLVLEVLPEQAADKASLTFHF